MAVADHNGIVNGSYSLLKHFDIKLNGKNVYDCIKCMIESRG